MQSNQPHYRWLPWALSRLYYPHLILMAPWLFRKEPVPHLNSAHLISMGPSSPPLTTPDIDGPLAVSQRAKWRLEFHLRLFCPTYSLFFPHPLPFSFSSSSHTTHKFPHHACSSSSSSFSSSSGYFTYLTARNCHFEMWSLILVWFLHFNGLFRLCQRRRRYSGQHEKLPIKYE